VRFIKMFISHVTVLLQIVCLLCSCIDAHLVKKLLERLSEDGSGIQSLKISKEVREGENQTERRIKRAAYPGYREKPAPTFTTTTVSPEIVVLVSCKVVKNVKRKCWTIPTKRMKICRVTGVSKKEVFSKKLKIKINSKFGSKNRLLSEILAESM